MSEQTESLIRSLFKFVGGVLLGYFGIEALTEEEAVAAADALIAAIGGVLTLYGMWQSKVAHNGGKGVHLLPVPPQPGDWPPQAQDVELIAGLLAGKVLDSLPVSEAAALRHAALRSIQADGS